MPNIFAIHGAFSSPRIYNYLTHKLNNTFNWNYLDYSKETGGIANIIANITPPSNPAHVVGHSMGGLLALALINQPWVLSVTTIACPLGGIDINPIQAYLIRSEFMQEVSTHSNFIKDIAKVVSTKPVQHLISTTGFNPWIYEPNDGVILVRSQRTVAWGPTYDIDANHAEIMLSDDTVSILDDFWK